MYTTLKSTGTYDAYLRKSRADVELEKLKKFDTLKQHEKFLIDRAKQLNINIRNIYHEVVSGESIQDRPEIQKLLKEVETGSVDGVLVVEIERLTRGDAKDQGIVAQTFKYSNTKIITLNKIYDPNSEEDEEYFEFGLFMSRREYKTINRRMQRGRLANVLEGKYCASEPPFGYTKVRVKYGKGFTLEPVQEEANIIKELFKKRSEGLGYNILCNWLNTLEIKPHTSDTWTPSTIRDILSNPIYIGKIRWNYSKTQKKLINGQIKKTRIKNNGQDLILVEGLHQPLIDEKTFSLVQSTKPRNVSTKKDMELHNPLATLVKCSFCGRTMQRRPYYKKTDKTPHIDTLICTKSHCPNVASDLYRVENAIIDALEDYVTSQRELLSTYMPSSQDNDELIFSTLKKDLEKYNKQLNKAYELVENEIYTPQEFASRTKTIKNKIASIEKHLSKIQNNIDKDKIENLLPKVEKIIESYHKTSSIEQKNKLLRSVIAYVEYTKQKGGRGYENNFSIIIHPKI